LTSRTSGGRTPNTASISTYWCLAAQNVTGIFVSHNLHHVFVSCERVVAMARGRIVLDKRIAETWIDEIIELM
jgi:simple sugar transport system ATP-binding protein